MTMSNEHSYDELNEAIASLPKNATLEKVISDIEPIFQKNIIIQWSHQHQQHHQSQQHEISMDHNEIKHKAFSTSPSRDSPVTPLMVACDKGQLECLRYFSQKCREHQIAQGDGVGEREGQGEVGVEVMKGRRQDDTNTNTEKEKTPQEHEAAAVASRVPVRRIIGHILDATTIDGGNQAIHYATFSSMDPSALDHLATILLTQQPQPQQKEMEMEMQEEEESMVQESLGSKKEGVHVAATTATTNENSLLFHAYLKILSQPNEHGDTPVMLAAATGNSELLKHWVQGLCLCIIDLDLQSHSDQVRVRERNQSLISELFTRINNDGDSALLLASGHGHFEIVELLIGTPSEEMVQKQVPTLTSNSDSTCTSRSSKKALVQVTYQDIQRVKDLLRKTKAIEHRIPPDRIEEFQSQQRNIQRCLDMMIRASEKMAEDAASELLFVEDCHEEGVVRRVHEHEHENAKTAKLDVQVSRKRTKKKKKKKQKPKQKIMAHPNPSVSLDPGEDEQAKEGTVLNFNAASNDIQETGSSEEGPKFVTLEDGTIISKKNESKFKDDRRKSFQETYKHTYIPGDEKSIQSMLRERCIQSQSQSQSHSSDANALSQQTTMTTTTSEEVMDALGLDASMLLMSPHGLANNLSPSQLEAVEQVLMIQMDAVAQAKVIHGRLMSSSSPSPSENAL